MSARIAELIDSRNRLVVEMRGIVDKARNEKRTLNDEESRRYDEIFAEQDKVSKTIEAEERTEKLDKEIAERAAKSNVPDKTVSKVSEEMRAVFGRRADEPYDKAFRSYILGDEFRALQSELDVKGGFVVTPMQFVQTMIKAVDDLVFIRGLATKFQVPTAEALGAPSLDADPDDGTWTTELKTGAEDDTMAFGRRELHPRPLAKRIKISNKLLRQVPGIEGFVVSRLAYKFAITHEKAFLTGTGANQPLGLFVASNDGIPTSRDISTDNTATALTMNGLINAKYGLKAQYQSRARWLFHRDAIKNIAKLRDESGGAGTGSYLWQPSKQVGEPDVLLGNPVMMSEYVPNTFTASQYVGMIADFSNYWIADATDMSVQRLLELYAETNQMGLIARMETDGMPVLSEAFVRVKLSA